MTIPHHGTHAIVIGGSMAGLLAARVLSEHMDQVTLIERDALHDAPEPRKGQPQTRHLHGLLARGLSVMLHYFPDLMGALRENGALVADVSATLRWHAFGGYRLQFDSGYQGALMSRPLLEWLIRRRVLALPNVSVLDGRRVEALQTTNDRGQVVGVRITRPDGSEPEMLNATLVVDASGRGSAVPRWLEALGYPRPEENVVKVGVAYATRTYRRRPGDLEGAELIMIAPDAPHNKRSGLIFPIEGDRWICSLGGWGGDHPPTDEQGYLAFARSLPAPDLYQLISKLEPVSEIISHAFPSSIRRHYERLAHFPHGLLVMGDAVCSFNPVYGQGMTSAALQAEALDGLLKEGGPHHNLAPQFFRRIAKIIDIPWQMAVGEDFRFRETVGRKAPGTDLINAYTALVHRATHSDQVVYGEFLKVMNLVQPPTSLFKPSVLVRVLKATRRARAVPLAQPAAGD